MPLTEGTSLTPGASLIVLFWDQNLDESHLRVDDLANFCARKDSAGFKINHRSGVWLFKPKGQHATDPAKKETYRVGSIIEIRDITSWHPKCRYGPIAVFDRMDNKHLDNLITVVETTIRALTENKLRTEFRQISK
jgi:hypothetical protein